MHRAVLVSFNSLVPIHRSCYCTSLAIILLVLFIPASLLRRARIKRLTSPCERTARRMLRRTTSWLPSAARVSINQRIYMDWICLAWCMTCTRVCSHGWTAAPLVDGPAADTVSHATRRAELCPRTQMYCLPRVRTLKYSPAFRCHEP